jgi:hypothetical protein
VRLQGKWYFHRAKGKSGSAIIKTQPSPDSYRDCLILQGKGKVVAYEHKPVRQKKPICRLDFWFFLSKKKNAPAAAVIKRR